MSQIPPEQSRFWEEDIGKSLDPDNKYPSDGLTGVEKMTVRVLKVLPDAEIERTRDVIQMSINGESGIVVLVTGEGIEIRLPTIEWTRGAYGPASSSRYWGRAHTEWISDSDLRVLLEAALQAREKEFSKCSICEEIFPPERVHIDDRHGTVCHGCSESRLGYVH